MRGAGLLWFAGVVFGQQALWETHGRRMCRKATGWRRPDATRRPEKPISSRCATRIPLRSQASRWNDLALMNRYLGNLVEGREQYWRALALMEQARGAASPDYAAILHNLAVLDYQDGKLEQAARQFHGALQIRQAVLGEKDPITAQTPDSWIGHFGDVSQLFQNPGLGWPSLPPVHCGPRGHRRADRQLGEQQVMKGSLRKLLPEVPYWIGIAAPGGNR